MFNVTLGSLLKTISVPRRNILELLEPLWFDHLGHPKEVRETPRGLALGTAMVSCMPGKVMLEIIENVLSSHLYHHLFCHREKDGKQNSLTKKNKQFLSNFCNLL